MNARNLLNAALFAATLVLAHCATPIFPGSTGGGGGNDPGYWSDGGMQTGVDSAVAPHADLATGAADAGGPSPADAAAADAATDALGSDAQGGDGLSAPDGPSSDGQDDLWWEDIPTADFADSPDGL